jgi:hypothetical protein
MKTYAVFVKVIEVRTVRARSKEEANNVAYGFEADDIESEEVLTSRTQRIA